MRIALLLIPLIAAACDPPKKDESGLKPWTYEPPKEPSAPIVKTKPAVDPSEAEEDPGPYPVTQLAIARAMASTKHPVALCAAKHKSTTPLAKVSLTVGNKGRVTAVTLPAGLKGTATGTCVEAAVKAAVFPPFDGQPFTIEYPYILR